MVKKGNDVLPLKVCRACASSAEDTVFSAKGTPRLRSSKRPCSHGAQLLAVYRVTGNWLTTRRSSKGSATPLALGAVVGMSGADPLAAGTVDNDGLSENVTRPSGPTMRYTLWACNPVAVSAITLIMAQAKANWRTPGILGRALWQGARCNKRGTRMGFLIRLSGPCPDGAKGHPKRARGHERL